MGWTDERIEILKELWKDGLSASQIAKQLRGVSRSAVIGKVHRLGFAGRATPSVPALLAHKTPRPKREKSESMKLVSGPEPQEHTGKRTAPVPVRYLDEAPGSATIQTLGDHMCKWPIGDPNSESFTSCGRRQDDGPYCGGHARLAYQPRQTKASKNRATELERVFAHYT